MLRNELFFNDYYPFGLEHKGYNNIIQNSNSAASKLKYNGKELNDELGLDWYDYGARNYDASLGRWMNVDVLSEKFESFSPYAYVGNSPIIRRDPDGMDWYTGADGNVHFNSELTEGNASDILKDGQSYYGNGAYIDVDHDNDKISTYFLNEDGSVSDSNGDKFDSGSTISIQGDHQINVYDDKPSIYEHKNGEEISSVDGHNYVLHDNQWLQVETPLVLVCN